MAYPEGNKWALWKKRYQRHNLEILPVACVDNAKGICITEKTKSVSIDKKAENSSAPSLENGANNGMSRGETAEKIDKGVVGLTFTTHESLNSYAPMDVLHVLHSESQRESKYYSFQKF